MAARQSGVWGIDLGQCALKAIRLEMKDGEPVATAFEYIEHPKILSQPDADPDELTREALTQFLSRNQIRGDAMAISVPGQSGLARFVKLPPVDEKKIADIVKFEAKQQIPFPLEEVVWDFQRLNKGDIIDGLALETEIGLFAMKRDMVTRAIAQFKDVGVEVHLVQMAPLALCNYIAYDLLGKGGEEPAEEEGSHECIVALEIGTDSSNLVITDGARIIWQRPIPIGGNHFTRALTKEMKLTFAKAEHLKKNAAKSPDLKKILSSLKQVLNDFVGEVQRSLGYFTNTHRNATIQYMVGLGNAFRLPGLQKFLQEKLQLEVHKLQKFERTTGESVVTAPTFAENIMSFGVAYGLALQGLKHAHLKTNLLPYEVRLERVIRGKKPWVVTAAASLLFGMCILAFAEGVEKKAIVNDDIKKHEKQLDDAIKLAQRHNTEKANQEKELKKHLDTLERIGAGVNQRLNWQLLHQYVNRASPQPDGGRLTKLGKEASAGEKIHERYWNDNAKIANSIFEHKKTGLLKDLRKEEVENFNDFFKRSKLDVKFEAGKEPRGNLEQFIKEHLIQINISGINALYTEDLGPYFRKIYADKPALPGMGDRDKKDIVAFAAAGDDAEKQKTSPLFEKGMDGWVVEIRGYTYHKDAEQFVRETIAQNLLFPIDLDAKDPELKEMADRVQKRVSSVLIYHSKKVTPVAGQPSQIVTKSFLKPLIAGSAPAAGDKGKDFMPGGGKQGSGGGPGVGGGQQQGGGLGEGKDPKKLDRSAWTPLADTVAASIYGDNTLIEKDGGDGGGGFPGKGGGSKGFGDMPKGVGGSKEGPKGGPMGTDGPKGEGPNNGATQTHQRTEFVLLFVWREPLLSEQPAGPDTKK